MKRPRRAQHPSIVAQILVHTQLGVLEASIINKATGEELNEYWPEYGMEGGILFSECYLETIDEPFDITLSRAGDLLTTCDINAFTHIDGRSIKSMSMADGRATAKFGTYKYADEEGRSVQSVLRFRPLPTTDDPDEATVTEAQVDRLGTVEVSFRMGERREIRINGRGRGGGGRDGGARNSRALEVGVADEKIKKMAYAVTTSDAKPCSRRQENRKTRTVWEYFGHNGGWVYKMYFHYRPRAVLNTMGNIRDEASPRPATPPIPRGYADDDRRPLIPRNKRWREATEEGPELERDAEFEGGDPEGEGRRVSGTRLADLEAVLNVKCEPDKKRLKILGGGTWATAVDLTLLDDDDEEEDELDELWDGER